MPEILCSKCGSPLTLDPDAGMFWCGNCGFKRPETLDEAAERIRARGQRPSIVITFRGDLDHRARSLFESGHEYLWRGDADAAIRTWEQALEMQPDFADAHLWIARTSRDEHVQRDHLGEIIAHDPGHLEALRMLMVLNGQMTPAEAERSREDRAPEIQFAESAVKAKTTALKCPVCGGGLTIEGSRVVCRFCGHTAPLDATRHASQGAEVLGAALLKRRAQPVRWVVGERILHCTRCGAERTIPAERLSAVCPFCGSTQVIQQDALGTVDQPDGLIPFVVDEDGAKVAIRERLNSVSERFAGLFGENRLARAVIEGIYLPYWVFDALVEVSKTVIDRRTPSRYEQRLPVNPYSNTRISDGLNGVCVAAVRTPLADQIAEFDLSAAVAYDPKLLAKHPAALYTLDFDMASLDARSRVSDHMRRRHGDRDGQNVEVQIFTSVVQMSFMLVLMPVWVATLYERDGDVRPALVNGQSGQVALGKAEKGV
ncbi:MAG: hypothetical protein LC121_23115 [Anaerolineae bacterium]|nr:hypothetical protein [Anaerolineae bacterium]